MRIHCIRGYSVRKGCNLVGPPPLGGTRTGLRSARGQGLGPGLALGWTGSRGFGTRPRGLCKCVGGGGEGGRG